MQRAGVVGLGRKRLGLPDFATAHDIREFAVQLVNQPWGGRIIKPDHQVVPNEAVGMKVAVKVGNFLDGRRGVGVDPEKGHFSLVDVTAAHHVIAKKLLPARPVGAAR